MRYNYGAGPGMLPESVLDRIQRELKDWNHGMSVMEVSHRSRPFQKMVEKSEADLRTLLSIPDSHRVLFMQGGARLQFSLIPANLLTDQEFANHAITGFWSKMAYEDASQFAKIDISINTVNKDHTELPSQKHWQLNPDATYLHYTDNETIHGVEFHWVPKTKSHLVSDMSSNLLSKRIDISRYALIYASTQKNMGIAGLTVVILREDCLKRAQKGTSVLCDYHNIIQSGSMLNTPPTFAWYVAGLMFEWMLEQGGLKAIEKNNQKKANKFYQYLDHSKLYHNAVESSCRSRMNIPFTLKDTSLDDVFLKEAEKRGLMQLQGHRSVGGMRASFYNAMPESGVDALIEFMREFEEAHSHSIENR